MFDESNIIVGLEIGTSKICVVVGEQGADGALNIVGLGQSRSRGVRKGEIVNPEQVEEDLRAAIFEAEQMADVEIRSVYLGVSGGHVRGFNNRGTHIVVSAERDVQRRGPVRQGIDIRAAREELFDYRNLPEIGCFSQCVVACAVTRVYVGTLVEQITHGIHASFTRR